MRSCVHNKFVSIIAYCLLVICYFFIPKTCFASGEFQADYNVQYAVAPSGTTIVTQNVTLTNKETNYYPQKYSITIDSQKISSVIAFDDGGLVSPDITELNGKTNIVLSFNNHTIGLNKELHFSLRYDDGDIAHRNGKIWEINIPGVPNDPDLATYAVSLSVPPTFGPNAYMSPPPDSAGKWSKDQMINGGVSAAYGTEQLFSLDLNYYIENANIVPTTTEIALPPDTAYQHIKITDIEPKPQTVVEDVDGNWLARYALLPAQRMTIHATAVVLLTLTPRAGVSDVLTDRQTFLKQDKYWETQDPEIQKLAKEYTTPEQIYSYVSHALTYDYTRVNAYALRRGAVGAIANPKSAVCMEFTDLFIAIARAAGIPAREAIGYAYTTNPRLRPLSLVSDVLHAWPEFYDDIQKIWIPVDPTWGNTTGGVDYFNKLDFNHIVFALDGMQSDYPYPAGFYKQSGSTTKDVRVGFTDKEPDFATSPLHVDYAFPLTATSGFSANGYVNIQNTDGVAHVVGDITVHSLPFDVNESEKISTLPPFAKLGIPIRIPLPGYFLKAEGSITTSIDGQESRYDFTVSPFIYRFLIPLISFAAILLIVSFVIIERKILWKHSHK